MLYGPSKGAAACTLSYLRLCLALDLELELRSQIFVALGAVAGFGSSSAATPNGVALQ